MEEIITIDKKEFLVVKKANYNNSNYLYVIATDNSNDVALLKEKEMPDVVYIESVKDEEEFKKVVELIITSDL